MDQHAAISNARCYDTLCATCREVFGWAEDSARMRAVQEAYAFGRIDGMHATGRAGYPFPAFNDDGTGAF